jgi:hypothetical protein
MYLHGHSLGSFALLPDCLLSYLTFKLDTRSICSLACCSKLLKVFAYQEPLWRHQALHGHDGPVVFLVGCSPLCHHNKAEPLLMEQQHRQKPLNMMRMNACMRKVDMHVCAAVADLV